MEVIVQGKKFQFDNGQVKFIADGSVSLTGGLIHADEVEITPENAAHHIAEFQRLMNTRAYNRVFAEDVLRNISAQITVTTLVGWPRYRYLLKKATNTAVSRALASPLIFCGIASLLYLMFMIYWNNRNR